MEILLLACMVLLLIILTVVIALLAKSVIRIRKLEEHALERVEQNTNGLEEAALPPDLNQGFQEILEKHQKHLDALLQTTITEFDKQFHADLQDSAQKQLGQFGNKSQVVLSQFQKDFSDFAAETKKQSEGELSELSQESKKLHTLLQKRLADHFTEIAWQYISQSLAGSVDLHSQKEAILSSLEENAKKIRKDYDAY